MKSAEVASKWDCLPSEALLCVFQSLGLVPSRTCAPVCKAWAHVADSPALWRSQLPTGFCFESHAEVKHCVIKRLTAKLYTWGSKILDVPGASLKNRLTRPTLVPGKLMNMSSSNTGCLGELPNNDWSNVQKVAAGENFCAMLSWEGSVTDTRSKPEDVASRDGSTWSSEHKILVRNWAPTADRIVSLAAGGGTASSVQRGGHVIAVSSSGRVWSWGSNSHGQLGLDICQEFIYEPEECLFLDSTDSIVGAACGRYHSAIWSRNGVLYTCGDNSQGACGHKDLDIKVHVFLLTEMSLHVVHAACSDSNTVLCDSNGYVWVTGKNSCGQCGSSVSSSNSSFEFVQIDLLSHQSTSGKLKQKGSFSQEVRVVSVAAAHSTMYALTALGEVFSWGRGSQGELGTGGSCKFQTVPSKLPWAAKITSIQGSSNGRFAATIDTHGRLFTWGEGKYGQLGHGNTSIRTTGRAVKHFYGSEVVNVACGLDFVMALTSWKMGSRHKSIKAQPQAIPKSSTMQSLPSAESIEEQASIEQLASSSESTMRPCEIASSSSPSLSTSPCITKMPSRKMRKKKHRFVQLGLDLGASNIDGDFSDTDYGVLVDSPEPSAISPSAMCDHSPPSSTSSEHCQVEVQTSQPAPPIVANDFPTLDEVHSSRLPLPEQYTHGRGKSKLKNKRAVLGQIVKAFANDPKRREHYFPATLSSSDRYKVHRAAEKFGVAHESTGQEPNRQVRVWKPLENRRPAQIPMHDYNRQTPEFDAFSLRKTRAATRAFF